MPGNLANFVHSKEFKRNFDFKINRNGEPEESSSSARPLRNAPTNKMSKIAMGMSNIIMDMSKIVMGMSNLPIVFSISNLFQFL